jgi:hypothetical protein
MVPFYHLFFQYCDSNIEFFSIAPHLVLRSSNFAIPKVVALTLFALIFECFFYIGLWLLFYIASHIVISLPTLQQQ